jgi:carbon monoxide dehydrogenase subunit G
VEPAGAGANGAAQEEGVEIYRVRVATGLGPVRLRAAGTARVRRDSAGRSVMADVSLSDPRAGSMYGTMALQVRPIDAERSEIRLEADIALASKMGEFAQPILRHKADKIVREFARNLAGTL